MKRGDGVEENLIECSSSTDQPGPSPSSRAEFTLADLRQHARMAIMSAGATRGDGNPTVELDSRRSALPHRDRSRTSSPRAEQPLNGGTTSLMRVAGSGMLPPGTGMLGGHGPLPSPLRAPGQQLALHARQGDGADAFHPPSPPSLAQLPRWSSSSSSWASSLGQDAGHSSATPYTSSYSSNLSFASASTSYVFAGNTPAEPLTVLLAVQDSEMGARFAAALEQEGAGTIRVDVVRAAVTALSNYLEGGVWYDAVVMETRFQYMDGFRALECIHDALGGRLPPPRKHDGGGLVGRHGGGGLSEGYLRAGAATRPAFVLVMTDDKVAYEPHRVGADLIVSDLFTLSVSRLRHLVAVHRHSPMHTSHPSPVSLPLSYPDSRHSSLAQGGGGRPLVTRSRVSLSMDPPAAPLHAGAAMPLPDPYDTYDHPPIAKHSPRHTDAYAAPPGFGYPPPGPEWGVGQAPYAHSFGPPDRSGRGPASRKRGLPDCNAPRPALALRARAVDDDDSSSASGGDKKASTQRACLHCHVKKVRCNAGRPCNNCLRHNQECVEYTHKPRGGAAHQRNVLKRQMLRQKQEEEASQEAEGGEASEPEPAPTAPQPPPRLAPSPARLDPAPPPGSRGPSPVLGLQSRPSSSPPSPVDLAPSIAKPKPPLNPKPAPTLATYNRHYAHSDGVGTEEQKDVGPLPGPQAPSPSSASAYVAARGGLGPSEVGWDCFPSYITQDHDGPRMPWVQPPPRERAQEPNTGTPHDLGSEEAAAASSLQRLQALGGRIDSSNARRDQSGSNGHSGQSPGAIARV